MLRLGERAVSFEASNTLSDIFFDNDVSKICTVRGNGAIGMTIKGVDSDKVTTARIKDAGKLKTVMFSPSGRLASVQRVDNAIDFIRLPSSSPSSPSSTSTDSVCQEWRQACKMGSAVIRAVHWISASQIVLVTSLGVELYQVTEEKKQTKLLKTLNIAADWSLYYAPSSLLLLASGPHSSVLQPILIQHGQLSRMGKIEVDFGYSNSKSKLLERDVTIGALYGSVYCMVLRYSARDSSTTDLALYEVHTDAAKTSAMKHTLILGLTGMFGIHVIDNLVIVHHQISATSLLFDIGLKPQQCAHSPLIHCKIESVPSCSSLAPLPLYTPSWVVFAPDIIIDPYSGVFSTLQVHAEKAEEEIEDKATLIEFLLNRRGCRKTLMEALRRGLEKRWLKRRQTGRIFDTINGRAGGTGTGEESGKEKSPGKDKLSCSTLRAPCEDPMKISQQEMQSAVFIPLRECASADARFLADTMLQYLASLNKYAVVVESYLLELLVEGLVAADQMDRLLQLVTYKVLRDSKQLAILLLRFGGRSPALAQAGVDMLSRSRASHEIVEYLLAAGRPVHAVRFVECAAPSERDKLNWIKVLDAAESQPRGVRHALIQAAKERRPKQGWPEHFSRFLDDSKSMFGKEELADAERENDYAHVLVDGHIEIRR